VHLITPAPDLAFEVQNLPLVASLFDPDRGAGFIVGGRFRGSRIRQADSGRTSRQVNWRASGNIRLNQRRRATRSADGSSLLRYGSAATLGIYGQEPLKTMRTIGRRVDASVVGITAANMAAMPNLQKRKCVPSWQTPAPIP
jgi:hypothetical protein